ncbi:TetR/AcrR family transcriptional regulator [Hydrogenophaga sp. BPS33]|uniref:TetR/AcrR family transcriptional regulator n=1 Tax=Hydrogenophaga sp. BPS33 TaxID=2651974 RepID=UPI00131F64D6|nr:TetR/AcrR family transcriptional regulator [Hydrogenophaga sp. BPS33]QHE84855.1 TetR/AcrR family transcriptional regulator [Hydrogenophaga sp. BPS33]
MENTVTKPKRATAAHATTLEPADPDRPANAREIILREAAILFSTKGFAESGLREIATMAGIRSSTVYYYFASKDRLYEEIIRMAVDVIFDSVNAQLSNLPENASPRMRIEAAIEGHLTALHSNKPFTSTNAQSRIKLPAEVYAVIQPMRERYSDFWRSLIQEAVEGDCLEPGIEPRMLRPLILGTLNRTVGWFDADEGSLQSLLRTTITTFSGIWRKPVDAPREDAVVVKKSVKAAPRRKA